MHISHALARGRGGKSRFDGTISVPRMGACHRTGEGNAYMVLLALHSPAGRALLAGMAYLLLRVSLTHIAWQISAALEAGWSPRAERVYRWFVQPSAGRAIALLASLGYLFAMLIWGILPADYVGVQSVDWAHALPWLLTFAGTGGLWLLVVWGIALLRGEHQDDLGPATPLLWLDLLPHGVYQEATLALLRAALAPLLGRYWGVWAGLLIKSLLSWTAPGRAGRWQRSDQRTRLILEWSLDWLSAALYLYTGTLWTSLIGRGVCSLLLSALLGSRVLLRRAPTMKRGPNPGQEPG